MKADITIFPIFNKILASNAALNCSITERIYSLAGASLIGHSGNINLS